MGMRAESRKLLIQHGLILKRKFPGGDEASRPGPGSRMTVNKIPVSCTPHLILNITRGVIY